VIEESEAPFNCSEVMREHAACIFHYWVHGHIGPEFPQYPAYEREDEEVGGVSTAESYFPFSSSSSGELLARGPAYD